MNKTEFKKKVRFEIYCRTYPNRTRINALFFDQTSNGFKYMVACEHKTLTKKKLLDVFYNWIVKEENPPYFVHYKYAILDQDRFKISLSLSI